MRMSRLFARRLPRGIGAVPAAARHPGRGRLRGPVTSGRREREPVCGFPVHSAGPGERWVDDAHGAPGGGDATAAERSGTA